MILVKVDLLALNLSSEDCQKIAITNGFEWPESGPSVANTDCRFLFFTAFESGRKLIHCNKNNMSFFKAHFADEIKSLSVLRRVFENSNKIKR